MLISILYNLPCRFCCRPFLFPVHPLTRSGYPIFDCQLSSKDEYLKDVSAASWTPPPSLNCAENIKRHKNQINLVSIIWCDSENLAITGAYQKRYCFKSYTAAKVKFNLFSQKEKHQKAGSFHKPNKKEKRKHAESRNIKRLEIRFAELGGLNWNHRRKSGDISNKNLKVAGLILLIAKSLNTSKRFFEMPAIRNSRKRKMKIWKVRSARLLKYKSLEKIIPFSREIRNYVKRTQFNPKIVFEKSRTILIQRLNIVEKQINTQREKREIMKKFFYYRRITVWKFKKANIFKPVRLKWKNYNSTWLPLF